MSSRVILSTWAEEALERAYQWYAERSPENAAKWYNGFLDALESLGDNPKRHALARENDLFPVEVRQLLYGRRRNYRALFTIRDDSIFVFAIRHAAQGDVSPEDLWN